MSLYRQTSTMRSSLRPFLRPAHRATVQQFQVRLATGDYGSGTGDPKGENPREQGISEKTRQQEHPGPDAPDVGQKSGSSGAQSSSSGQRKPEKSGGKGGKNFENPQPKILGENKLNTDDEDVKKHNEELKNRKEKPTETAD